MRETSVRLKNQDYINSLVLGQSRMAVNPLKQILEHVNILGLEGFKVERMEFRSDVYDLSKLKFEKYPDRFDEVVFYSSRHGYTEFYELHGQGD